MALNRKSHHHCNNCHEETTVDVLHRCNKCQSYATEFINYTDEMIDCPDCDGEGSVEVGPECNRPASQCCGGCYKDAQCGTCEGEKQIENPHFEEEDAE